MTCPMWILRREVATTAKACLLAMKICSSVRRISCLRHVPRGIEANSRYPVQGIYGSSSSSSRGQGWLNLVIVEAARDSLTKIPRPPTHRNSIHKMTLNGRIRRRPVSEAREIAPRSHYRTPETKFRWVLVSVGRPLHHRSLATWRTPDTTHHDTSRPGTSRHGTSRHAMSVEEEIATRSRCPAQERRNFSRDPRSSACLMMKVVGCSATRPTAPGRRRCPGGRRDWAHTCPKPQSWHPATRSRRVQVMATVRSTTMVARGNVKLVSHGDRAQCKEAVVPSPAIFSRGR
mmetsp:Transcript_29920/g.79684  ORF Transcript_29920/g.79684 Transcript_29920/m.79684 type:complete len:289 (-) Transcript_29920:1291-2157(-)